MQNRLVYKNELAENIAKLRAFYVLCNYGDSGNRWKVSLIRNRIESKLMELEGEFNSMLSSENNKEFI